MQRLRIRFRRGAGLKFISHLDVMRLWVRALRRAGVPLAYSEGYTPHPRVSLAAPLSVGMTGESEFMDVFLNRPVSPHWFLSAVNRQLPSGMEALEAYPIAPSVPSLQSQVSFAHYRVEVETEKAPPEIESAISALLKLQNLPWRHERDTGTRHYDLRTLIADIHLVECRDEHEREPPGARVCVLEMTLRNDERGSGRPEQVALALGFKERPRTIERTRLTLTAGRR